MSEVGDAVIKRTQDLLGKIIKKPILTEKLLRKPPFKFLHDIIHAVIRTTGFLGGLYSDEELQSENMNDRDAKMAFLQKTIDALKLATKQEVKARPSKIVAGLEADKTNELLIAIAKAIDRKIDATEAVALVKSGNVAGIAQEKKDAKSTKNEPRKAKKEKKEKKESISPKKVKTGSDSKALKNSESYAKLGKQSNQDSTESGKPKTTPSSQHKEKNKGNEKERKNEREKVARIKAESGHKVVKPDTVELNIETPRTNESVNNIIVNQDLSPNILKADSIETIEKPENSSKATLETETKEKFEEPLVATKSDENATNETNQIPAPPPAVTLNIEQEKIEKVEKAEKIPNDEPRSSKTKKIHTKHEAAKVTNDTNARSEGKLEKLTNSKSVDKFNERPLIAANKQLKQQKALRSAAARPISARPSAPRRRDRNIQQNIHTENFVQESGDQTADKKNYIPEFDDADIVITETISDNISTIDEPITKTGDGELDGKQGHLVQQILETQTAILKSDAKNDVSAITDESILNDPKSITRNMTELRKMIQKLSLYITPLGKMMEYFQEDVDAMQIELLMWQKAGADAEADIKKEQRTTEKLLENFKYNLAEINNSIKDHAEQINNTTRIIIQNEEKISKMIVTS